MAVRTADTRHRTVQRMALTVRGAVQGVGFRPFVFCLATSLHLTGWVGNTAQGVQIEVEGPPERLGEFVARLRSEPPAPAVIEHVEWVAVATAGDSAFEIRRSSTSGARTALILPDLATCAECVREIFTPGERRFRYPFTNCTRCGPRYSIIEGLPYDRANTTMRGFALCPDCRAEFADPRDRRFHAQPIACPACGPRLSLWDRQGRVVARGDDALLAAADAVRQGRILALKGLGGFQLILDARRPDPVLRLRRFKRRPDKPFALLYPSLDLVQAHCEVSSDEAALLASAEAPIVLLRRRDGFRDEIYPGVAPDCSYLGIMLPYTPLHHLLAAVLRFPVVATSGNLVDEPICIEEGEALARLGPVADTFLVHDRPIARHVDDSVARIVLGAPLVLRRARGYAPLPVTVPDAVPPVIATGAHLKNTVALAVGKHVFISQHIGDLETPEAVRAAAQTLAALREMYALRPTSAACDMHPDYRSTRAAEAMGLPVLRVQHHYAHVLAVMAEHGLRPPVLGVAWDGTGYGADQTVWGGEFLRITGDSFERAGHLRTFPLPGGEAAVREPRRAALGVLYEMYGDGAFDLAALPLLEQFTREERVVLRAALRRAVNTPRTSSAGRLFDAVAALVGVRYRATYEGQAASDLERAAERVVTDQSYPYALRQGVEAPLVVDWAPALRAIAEDAADSTSPDVIAAKFHNTLVEMIVGTVRALGARLVVLTGGCFQNRLLLERAVLRLGEAGIKALWPRTIPPNDGGIALGQVLAAARQPGR